jgi:hypothetical protein
MRVGQTTSIENEYMGKLRVGLRTAALQVGLEFKGFIAVVLIQAILDTLIRSDEVKFSLLVAVVKALSPVPARAVALFADHLALVLEGILLGLGVGVDKLEHVHRIFTRAAAARGVAAKGEADEAGLLQTVVVVLGVVVVLLGVVVVLFLLLLFLAVFSVLTFVALLLVLVVVLLLVLLLFVLPIAVGAHELTASQVLDEETRDVKLVVRLVLVLVPIAILRVVVGLLELTKVRRGLDNLSVLEKSASLVRLGVQHLGRSRDKEESNDGLLEHLASVVRKTRVCCTH